MNLVLYRVTAKLGWHDLDLDVTLSCSGSLKWMAYMCIFVPLCPNRNSESLGELIAGTAKLRYLLDKVHLVMY